MEPVCKHVVAVIFYLQEDKLALKQPNAFKTKEEKNKVRYATS
ncbi:hypothetical protein J3359_12000 [Polaribacter cellanae]|uniref:SWIM-type domain-containing protein n=2 Tax=Polaribacter cellanae TaxID=2818493 RepID=A0A975CLK6_9FLAO|nr:hypothetical protein [Polaribacter cellanae]QTE21544.1 hypothetical protein J3359_12000 [Polaribacter cellanae]